jgi:hypothetical protein
LKMSLRTSETTNIPGSGPRPAMGGVLSNS